MVSYFQVDVASLGSRYPLEYPHRESLPNGDQAWWLRVSVWRLTPAPKVHERHRELLHSNYSSGRSLRPSLLKIAPAPRSRGSHAGSLARLDDAAPNSTQDCRLGEPHATDMETPSRLRTLHRLSKSTGSPGPPATPALLSVQFDPRQREQHKHFPRHEPKGMTMALVHFARARG